MGLLVLGTAAGLAIGEIGARLLWDAFPPATELLARRLAKREARLPKPEPRPAAPETTDEDLPELRGVLDLARPNQRGLFKGVPYRTNSRGFRGPEVQPVAPRDVFRIAIGGDSVTMGEGVLESETYAAQLQSLLAESGGRYRAYEVLNLGVSGINIDHVARRLERIGLRLLPDLAVYGFTINDIEGPRYEKTISTETALARTQRHARFLDSPSYLLRMIWPRAIALWELWEPGVGTTRGEILHNYFDNPEAWEDFTVGLDHLAEIGDEAGICVHVLVHTFTAQLNWLHPFSRVYARVEEAAVARGLTVTQSFPYFSGGNPAELRVSAFDPHPNAQGHALLARALHDGLRALPERCFEKAPPHAIPERPRRRRRAPRAP